MVTSWVTQACLTPWTRPTVFAAEKEIRLLIGLEHKTLDSFLLTCIGLERYTSLAQRGKPECILLSERSIVPFISNNLFDIDPLTYPECNSHLQISFDSLSGKFSLHLGCIQSGQTDHPWAYRTCCNRYQSSVENTQA